MRAWTLGVVMLGARLAFADPSTPRDLAREHYEAGSAAYRTGDYSAACREFHAAYTIAPAPQLLFNLGRCAEKLGQLREALDAYERFVAVQPDEDTENRIAALRIAIANQPVPPPPITTPPIVTEPVTTPPVAVTTAPSRKPIYKRAALWVPIGVVVAAGVAIGLGVGLTRPHDTRFPNVDLTP